MADTMTITKSLGAFCGAFLVFLLGKWAAETLYHVGGDGDHSEQAYSIPVDGGGDVEAEAVPDVDFEVVYAAASAEAGEKLWRPCAACHKLEDGANGVGPHLFGIVGRDKGSVSGYSYSEGLASMEGDWTPENLQAFLENPKGYVAGTKMSYGGMRNIEDRANIIAYLATFGS